MDNGKGSVTLILGRSEALVLFELLADFYEGASLQVRDEAERLSLVRLFGALEKTLIKPFSPDYKDIGESARARLIAESGSISWGTLAFASNSQLLLKGALQTKTRRTPRESAATFHASTDKTCVGIRPPSSAPRRVQVFSRCQPLDLSTAELRDVNFRRIVG
jgi:hypothetical protein